MKHLKLWLLGLFILSGGLVGGLVLTGFGEETAKAPASITQVQAAVTTAPVVEAPKAPSYNVTIEDLLAGTNAQRATPLTLDPVLNDTAMGHCNYMTGTGVFEHGNWENYLAPTGRSYYGENISYGARISKAVVKGWVESPPHLKNIRDTDFHRVGFAICDFQDTKLVVQHFSN